MHFIKKISHFIRYWARFLPLAGILVGSALPLPVSTRPWLIAATLIWFQVFIIFEVFGK